MAIEFSCPKCQHAVRTPDITAGKKGQCPSCKEVIQIPQKTPKKSRVIEFACHSCGKPMRTPAQSAGKKGKCPSCQSIVEIPESSDEARVTEDGQLSFDCTECGNQVRTPQSAAGKKGRCPQCKTLVRIPSLNRPKKARLNLLSQLDTQPTQPPARPKLDLLAGLDDTPAAPDKPKLDLLGSLAGPAAPASNQPVYGADADVDDLIAGVMDDSETGQAAFRTPANQPRPKPAAPKQAPEFDELVASASGEPVWKDAVDDELTVGVSVGDRSVKHEVAPQSARRIPADHYLDGLGVAYVPVVRMDVVSSEEVELLNDLPAEQTDVAASAASRVDAHAETVMLSSDQLMAPTDPPPPEAAVPGPEPSEDNQPASPTVTEKPEEATPSPSSSESASQDISQTATAPQQPVHYQIPARTKALDALREQVSGTLGLVPDESFHQQVQGQVAAAETAEEPVAADTEEVVNSDAPDATVDVTAAAATVGDQAAATSEPKSEELSADSRQTDAEAAPASESPVTTKDDSPERASDDATTEDQTPPQPTDADGERTDETVPSAEQPEAPEESVVDEASETAAAAEEPQPESATAPQPAEKQPPSEVTQAIVTGDSLEFACVHCHETVVTPLATAGKKGQCPSCEKIIRIPKDPRQVTTETPQPQKRDSESSVLEPKSAAWEPSAAVNDSGPQPAAAEPVQAANVQEIVPAAPIGAPLANIEFNCPACKEIVETPGATAGKQGKCPHCQTIVPIPMQSDVTKEPEPVPAIPITPAQPVQPAPSSLAAEDDGQDYQLTGGPAAPMAGPSVPGLTPLAGATPAPSSPLENAIPGAPVSGMPATPGLTPLAGPAVTPGLTPLPAAGTPTAGLTPLADPAPAPLATGPLQPAPAAALEAAPAQPRKRRVGSSNVGPLVMPPAVGMLVVGGIAAVHHVIFLIWILVDWFSMPGVGAERAEALNVPTSAQVEGIMMILTEFAGIFGSAGVCATIILGGVSLLNQERYAFVMTTAIFLTLGLCGWHMIIWGVYITEYIWSAYWGITYVAVGAPIGIYAIVILALPQVKSRFR